MLKGIKQENTKKLKYHINEPLCPIIKKLFFDIDLLGCINLSKD